MRLKVSIIQYAPVYYDLQKSLRKLTELVAEAAEKKPKIIVLGETWLPGYPAWLDVCPDAALWNHNPTKEVFAVLRENSLIVPSKETNLIGVLAKKYNVVIVIGVNERVEGKAGNGTLFNSLLTFNSNGKLINHHRKLVPTYTERMIWGQGNARGLKTIDSSAGRIGGLICWEHWMPLSRQKLHNDGEQIHVAVWPSVKEMHQIASRHYAFEGRCFVLASGLIMKREDMPKEFQYKGKEKLLINGGSCIIAPDGSFITEPLFDKEAIISAELDLRMIDKEMMTMDTTGHYSRSDIFNFSLKENTQ
jgi:nitrilase